MELLTSRQRDQLLANGKATAAALAIGNDPPDHFPVVKLFNPAGAGTWLLSELDPDEPDIAFGLCDLGMGCAELGSVFLPELQSYRGILGLGIERDLHWTAIHPIGIYSTAAQRAGRIITAHITLDIYAAIAKGGAA